MAERQPRRKPAIEGSRLVPEVIPDDVRAELDAELNPKAQTPTPDVRVEPVPEDVLAEIDAEARAKALAMDPDSRPIDLVDDSDR